jgi:hypothetical protein
MPGNSTSEQFCALTTQTDKLSDLFLSAGLLNKVNTGLNRSKSSARPVFLFLDYLIYAKHNSLLNIAQSPQLLQTIFIRA